MARTEQEPGPPGLRPDGGGRDLETSDSYEFSSNLGRFWATHRFEWVSASAVGVALAIMVAIFSAKSPFFLTTGNAANVGRAIVYEGVVSAAMTLVLICGELDLSVGSMIGLAGIAAAEALAYGEPGWVAIVLGLAVGLAGGVLNAGLIVGIGLNPLICTIGTSFIFLGLAYIWSGGNAVATYGVPGFSYLGGAQVGPVYVSTILFFAVVIVLGTILAFTKYGSDIYSIGGSKLAARRVGIHLPRVRTSVYLLCGLAAALGGVLVTSGDGSASPTSGMGTELTIIAAVIIGGTALNGGRGNMIGTLLGVLLFGVLQNGVDLLGIQSYWQTFITGVVLIVAITIDQLFRRRQQVEE